MVGLHFYNLAIHFVISEEKQLLIHKKSGYSSPKRIGKYLKQEGLIFHKNKVMFMFA